VVPEVERVTKLNFYNPDNKSAIDELYHSRNHIKNLGQTASTGTFYKPNHTRSSLKSNNVVEKEKLRIQEKERKSVNSNDRFENMAIEQELEVKRRKIEAKIGDKNQEKYTILRKLGEIEKKLTDFSLKIHVLDHLEQYFDMNQKLRKTIEREAQERKVKKLDSDKMLKLRQNFRVNFSLIRPSQTKEMKKILN
jgi:hypothetical protein